MKHIGIQIKDKNNNNIYPNPFPIGAIYMSVDSRNPSQIFGGTWTKIEGRFLWATGSTPKATGGSMTHYHDFKIGHRMNWFEIMCDNYANQGAYSYQQGKYSKSYGSENSQETLYNGGHQQGSGGTITESIRYSIGDTTSSSNMPPYFEVYMWYRVG